ncbi:MAG: PriCT-2 domain-containing protein [Sulfuritalea sp.]|nr:PriCT-2 domain-containing protein [Sulfuritalea sp.]
MTNASPASMFNLPTQTISAEELRLSMPKPQRLRKVKHIQVIPPSVEIMAELKGLLKQLHPDDPHPKRSWMRILIIVNYETAGHPDGFALADAWSRRGSKYKGPAGVRKFWKGMKPCPHDPLRINTLRWMVDQKSQGL